MNYPESVAMFSGMETLSNKPKNACARSLSQVSEMQHRDGMEKIATFVGMESLSNKPKNACARSLSLVSE